MSRSILFVENTFSLLYVRKMHDGHNHAAYKIKIKIKKAYITCA